MSFAKRLKTEMSDDEVMGTSDQKANCDGKHEAATQEQVLILY